MNVERLTKIAEWLEGGAKHEKISFDMSTGLLIKSSFVPENLEEYNQCGSTCCIAGAAVQFFNKPFELLTEKQTESAYDNFKWAIGDEGEAEINWDDVKDEARDVLDLDEATATNLFEPWSIEYLSAHGFFEDFPEYNTPAYVARVIRKLIATGEVDWSLDKAVA